MDLDKRKTVLALQSGAIEIAPIRRIYAMQALQVWNPNGPGQVSVYRAGRETSLVTFKTRNDLVLAGDGIILSVNRPVELETGILLPRAADATTSFTTLVSPGQEWYALSWLNPGALEIIERKLLWLTDDPTFLDLLDKEIRRIGGGRG